MEQENQSQQNQEDGQGLVATLRRQLQMMREASGDNNPLLELLESFLSLFLGINDDSDAPNFDEITDPAERAAAQAEYNRSRRDRERSEHGDARESASQWTAGDVMASSGRLLELRRQLEAANGGQRIDAINPVDDDGYRITSRFGRRESPGGVGSTNHRGVDFAGRNPGDQPPIVAAMPGVVVYSGVRGGYGNMVEIMDIYGIKHRYGHLASDSVRVGQVVQQGEQIGIMGTTGNSTGVHLHYEQRDGANNARDPLPHLNLNGAAVTPASRPTAPETPERPNHTPPRAQTPTPPAAPAASPTTPAPAGNDFANIRLPELSLNSLRQGGEEFTRNADRFVRDGVSSLMAGIGNLGRARQV